jgi:very-short-patch-repair endonuclease
LRIAQQRVDYVVCTRRCEVVAVVELDDKTHSRAKDQLRDARLEQGRIRTVRFQAKSKPGIEAIRTLILGAVPAGVEKDPTETATQSSVQG